MFPLLFVARIVRLLRGPFEENIRPGLASRPYLAPIALEDQITIAMRFLREVLERRSLQSDLHPRNRTNKGRVPLRAALLAYIPARKLAAHERYKASFPHIAMSSALSCQIACMQAVPPAENSSCIGPANRREQGGTNSMACYIG